MFAHIGQADNLNLFVYADNVVQFGNDIVLFDNDIVLFGNDIVCRVTNMGLSVLQQVFL